MDKTPNYKYGDTVIFQNGIKHQFNASLYDGVLPNTEATFVRRVSADQALVRISKIPNTPFKEKCTMQYPVSAPVKVSFKDFERAPA